MTFDTLLSNAGVLKAIAALGYSEPTPIQREAIPYILDTSDLLGIAQTGTGKTAAFGLPIVQKLAQMGDKPAAHQTRSLILAPTRELAVQIYEAMREFARFSHLKIAVVYGGVSLLHQTRELAHGVDILVATPGRLLDHMQQKHISLEGVKFLVLDEADRMLDMGFIHDIRRILDACTGEKQSMLFSATFSKEIKALAKGLLYQPHVIEIAPNRDVAAIEQHFYRVPKQARRDALRDLIVDNNWEQVLVFTRMKHSAARLAYHLAKDGFTVAAIHGDKTQSARLRALNDFKEKKIRILVATDIASRGIDIEELPYVVNFELPANAEDYVHRIGRTGRAGATGLAVSLLTTEDAERFGEIQKLLKKRFDVTPLSYEGIEDEPQEKAKSSEAKKSGKKAAKKDKIGEMRREEPMLMGEKAFRQKRDVAKKSHRDERGERQPFARAKVRGKPGKREGFAPARTDKLNPNARQGNAMRRKERRQGQGQSGDFGFDYVLPDFVKSHKKKNRS